MQVYDAYLKKAIATILAFTLLMPASLNIFIYFAFNREFRAYAIHILSCRRVQPHTALEVGLPSIGILHSHHAIFCSPKRKRS